MANMKFLPGRLNEPQLEREAVGHLSRDSTAIPERERWEPRRSER